MVLEIGHTYMYLFKFSADQCFECSNEKNRFVYLQKILNRPLVIHNVDLKQF